MQIHLKHVEELDSAIAVTRRT